MDVETLPKKLQKKRAEQYSMCFLYNTVEAQAKLTGLTVAACNPTVENGRQLYIEEEQQEVQVQQRSDFTSVSEKMSCNYCNVDFESRKEQKGHYKSDWHRYNLRQRLKGGKSVTEEEFEELSGCVSSISGSDSDSDDNDNESHAVSNPIGITGRFQKRVVGSSTDSESDDVSVLSDDRARKYPKIFLKNSNGDLISIYRCVVYHKHVQPHTYADLISMVTAIPSHMKWAVFMSSGGHFAGAVFDGEKILVHKTFHRYVVRAKRGTAQSSRDSQGNAPKSAGATLRRYNEAALKEDVGELLSSWDEHIKSCHLIFLRAPGFNRNIFFSGKSPPLDKKDKRIRMIPFQTKRPTHNEVQRVHRMLASIECYGKEAVIQDYVPLSPPLTYSSDMGRLVVIPDDIQSPSHRRRSRDKLGTSPLARDWSESSADGKSSLPKELIQTSMENKSEGTRKSDSGRQKEGVSDKTTGQLKAQFEHLLLSDSVTTSSASDTEMVEVIQTIGTGHLKEFAMSKKPKRKKNTRKRRPSIKHRQEPDINPLDEDRYHLKNSLYTACKVGDADTLMNLLAVFDVQNLSEEGQRGQDDSEVTVGQQGEGDSEVTEDRQGQGVSEIKEGQKHVTINVMESVTERTQESTDKIKFVIGSEDVKSVTGMTQESKDKIKFVIGSEDVKSVTGMTQESKDKIKFVIGSEDVKSVTGMTQESKVSGGYKSADHRLTTVKNQLKYETKIAEGIINTGSEIFSIEVNEPDSGSPHGSYTEETVYSDKTSDNAGEVKTAVNRMENKSAMKLDVKDTSQPSSRDQSRSRHSSGHPSSREHSRSRHSSDIMSPILVTVDLLNEPIGDSKTTLLMVASKEGHYKLIQMLLKTGANPAIRDRFGQTAYQVAKDKDTRNEFRRYMASFPDRYDYEESKIPGPLTEEMEAERRKKEAERKKVQKKAKQERDKEKKIEQAKQRAEEEEKNRFLSLTDREKRAIAAEKRLQQQNLCEGKKVVLSRCFQCGSDMTAKVPFEYFDYKFCSPKCLQQHRQKSTKS